MNPDYSASFAQYCFQPEFANCHCKSQCIIRFSIQSIYFFQFGIFIALGSMICKSFVYITLRFLQDLNCALPSICYGAIGLVFSLLLLLYDNLEGLQVNLDAETWIILIFMSLFVLLGVVFVSQALRFEKASLVSLVRSCDVIFSFFWDLTVGKIPSALR